MNLEEKNVLLLFLLNLEDYMLYCVLVGLFWSVVRAAPSVLESCLNSLGLILERIIIDVGLVVCSWFECKGNVVKLFRKELLTLEYILNSLVA